MEAKQTKIIVIHDGLNSVNEPPDPLFVELRTKFGKGNVIHFLKSNDGLKYVQDNLDQKMIVLLDLNFPNDELSGTKVFDEIRKKTSLVYVIIMTASDLSDIKREDLIDFINNDALAFLGSTEDTEKIVNMIDKAAHILEVRVDVVLEDWISKQTPEKRNKPFLKIKDGKQYTLEEILTSIRQQTELGKRMEQNILKLAVDLLGREKTKLDE